MNMIHRFQTPLAAAGALGAAYIGLKGYPTDGANIKGILYTQLALTSAAQLLMCTKALVSGRGRRGWIDITLLVASLGVTVITWSGLALDKKDDFLQKRDILIGFKVNGLVQNFTFWALSFLLIITDKR